MRWLLLFVWYWNWNWYRVNVLAKPGFVFVTAPGNEDLIEQIEFEKQQKLLKETSEKSSSFQHSKIINIDQYRFDFPIHYTIEIILDPCRYKNPGCCQDVFGTPTYIVEGVTKNSKVQAPKIVDIHGNSLLVEVSRLADRYTVFDSSCYMDSSGQSYRLREEIFSNGTKELKEDYEDETCIGFLQALAPSVDSVRPACWDRNDSINALLNCYAVDGLVKHHCVSVGYTQTAFIHHCGGIKGLHNHCGTFLELHEPGNERILSQTRLLGEFTSGYRTTTLPLYFLGNRSRTICRGNYEIWWVQRTNYDFVIQYIKKLYIDQPFCDYDPILNRYTNYHTIGTV